MKSRVATSNILMDEPNNIEIIEEKNEMVISITAITDKKCSYNKA